MNLLETIPVNDIAELVNFQTAAVASLEAGKIIYLPLLTFNLIGQEKKFLSPAYVNPKSKNISYDINLDNLKSFNTDISEQTQLKVMMRRYAIWAEQLIFTLLPSYKNHLEIARTSFRPIEILGRKSPSIHKDDTRLHVDAFPATPNQGRRILRVFTNINPDNKTRVWKTGEDFERVAQKFFPQLPKPFPVGAKLLKFVKLTRGLRTSYDHYMLNLHNTMKADDNYQRHAMQEEIHFPAFSTWIVYTDRVSHAALSGQHLLEQTFHLPVHAMQNPNQAPLRILEKIAQQKLV